MALSMLAAAFRAIQIANKLRKSASGANKVMKAKKKGLSDKALDPNLPKTREASQKFIDKIQKIQPKVDEARKKASSAKFGTQVLRDELKGSIKGAAKAKKITETKVKIEAKAQFKKIFKRSKK